MRETGQNFGAGQIVEIEIGETQQTGERGEDRGRDIEGQPGGAVKEDHSSEKHEGVRDAGSQEPGAPSFSPASCCAPAK